MTKEFKVTYYMGEEGGLSYCTKEISSDSMQEGINPKDLEAQKKPDPSLVPASVIIALSKAFSEGARKYGAFNWRKNKVQSSVYIGAAMRHILSYQDGEDIDPEGAKHHLDGALASLAVLRDAIATGNVIDTRPPKGVAAQMIRGEK